MAKPKRVQPRVAFLSLIALASCSGQSTPPAGARAPTATSATSTTAATSTTSAIASASPPAAAPAAPTPSAAGSTAAPSGKMCGGFAGIQCPEKQFCSFPLSAKCGAGDMAGTCQPIPEACTMEFAPVCGCDAKTYANACVASRSGISVATTSACAGDSGSGIAEGKTCGTRGVHGDCAEGLYCAYRSQCGATDSGGICSKKPQACTREYMPVCGCDNQTYPNKCAAAHNGTSVAATGECKANK